MNVLVAEDQPSVAQMLRIMLQNAGYGVVLAGDGKEAWAALQRRDAPKLAILDWMMPGMTGFEVCRKLRQTNESIRTYVIFLTAKTAKEDIVSALDAGGDDYITKPCNKGELLARLRAGERMVALQQQYQCRIDEVQSLVRRYELLGDKLHNQAGQSDAGMPTSLEINQVFTKTLKDLGIDSIAKKAKSTLEGHAKQEFTAWSAVILKRDSLWLDIKMEADRVSAWSMWADATGTIPDSNERLLDILGGILNMTQANLKRAFLDRGDEVITPFIPKAMPVQNFPVLSSPAQESDQYTFTAPDIAIPLVVDRHPAPIVKKTVYELLPFDVLADDIYSPDIENRILLNKDVVLDDHYILKLKDLSKFKSENFPVSVIEPSPLTKAINSA
jgi:DNA-binding response OmpR family regulator